MGTVSADDWTMHRTLINTRWIPTEPPGLRAPAVEQKPYLINRLTGTRNLCGFLNDIAAEGQVLALWAGLLVQATSQV